MDPSEFQDGVAQAAAYDPMSLSNPWVVFTAIALVLLILFLGWHFGDRNGAEAERRRRAKHIDHLWKEINDKARTAAAAPRHQVISAAQDLVNKVNHFIGPVVKVGALGATVGDLELALKGEPLGDHGHGHGHGDHGHGGHGGGDHGHGEHGKAEPARADDHARISINIGDVTHAPKPDAGHGHGGHGGHGKGGIDIDAVRKAISAFHDYWDRAETKPELKAAQRALMG